MLFEQKLNKLNTNYTSNQSNPYDIYGNSRAFTDIHVLKKKLLIIAVQLLIIAVQRKK